MIPLLFGKKSRLWNPRDLPNFGSVEFWYSRLDTSTLALNGSNLASWRDKGTKGRLASQGVASSQPTPNNDGIVFDGTDDFLEHSGFTWGESNHLFILIRPTAFTNNRYVYSSRTSATNGYSLIRVPGNLLWDFGGSLTNRLTLSFDLGVDEILLLSFHRTATGRIVRRNGTITDNSANAGNLTLANSGGTTFNIAKDPNGSTFNFGGEVREMILVNAPLNNLDIDRITGYIAHTNRVSSILASNHPYKNFAPRK